MDHFCIEHTCSKMLRFGVMQVDQIVALLIAERDRLTNAIVALQGAEKKRGRPPGSSKKPSIATKPVGSAPIPRKRKLSAAGRKAIAEAARRRWAAVKAGKAPSPFAKRVSLAKTSRG
jgi:hypothetical protein